MASTVLQVLLFCLTCRLASGVYCHPNDLIEHTRRCYDFVDDELSWTDAELHCVALGRNLVSVRSSREEGIVKRLVNEKHVWIGANDCTKKGKWLWSDGSAFDYTSWGSGAPGNRKKEEHCVEMNNLGAMNVQSCDVKKPFVCAKIIPM